jgi:sulfopyruvate decarboxylase TPP-binding subunit
MIDGTAVVAALRHAGVTDVVWIPDTELGSWEQALSGVPELRLIRACREGEAIGIAAGLLLGGRRPLVCIQCTGLFEAGDALRNVVHDMKLPLFLLVGVRSYGAYQKGARSDTCPEFAEPIVRTWQIPFTWLRRESAPADLENAYQEARKQNRPAVALLPE